MLTPSKIAEHCKNGLKKKGKTHGKFSINRWKQHIKRGLGAEAPTRNKLYPAMKSIGVENFTFEIIEECSRGELDEREDFWQEYFHDFGFSIK